MTEPLKPCREDLVPEVKDIAGYAEREPFTLEQLASHTSGLDREPSSADGLLWRPWRAVAAVAAVEIKHRLAVPVGGEGAVGHQDRKLGPRAGEEGMALLQHRL